MSEQHLADDLTQGRLPHTRRPLIYGALLGIAVLAFFALGYGMVKSNTHNADDAEARATPAVSTEAYVHRNRNAYVQTNTRSSYKSTSANNAPRATATPVLNLDQFKNIAYSTIAPPPTVAPAQEGEVIVYDRNAATTTTSTASATVLPIGQQASPAPNHDVVPAIAQQQHPFAMPRVSSTPAPIDISPDQGVLIQFDQDVDSNLAGIVKVHIIHDICDKRNRGVAFPAGTQVQLLYGNQIASGTRHLGFSAYRMTFPDGTRVALFDTDVQDLGGHEGITGKIDTHSWQLFRDSFVQSLSSGIVQLGTAALTRGNSVSINSTGTPLVSTASEPPVNFTISKDTVGSLALAEDYEADAPYHGEYCLDR